MFRFDFHEQPTADNADEMKDAIIMKSGEKHELHMNDIYDKKNYLAVDIDSDLRMHIVQTDELGHDVIDDELKDILSTSDIQNGVYEGGFKLWECAVDLVQFLKQTDFPIPPIVMELGCGHGLPGIYTLPKAQHVIFMDYNYQVCMNVTQYNIMKNCHNMLSNHEKQIDLYSGDWDAIVSRFTLPKAQLILTADTLYTEKVSYKLYQMIRKNLDRENGVALVAAKKYYFGTGGSVYSFQSIIAQDPELESKIIWTQEDGQSNIRHIVQVNFIKPLAPRT